MKSILASFLGLALTMVCSSSLLAAQPGTPQHPAFPCHKGQLWSKLFGSASESPAQAGDFVHIESNLDVVLDENTENLGGLWIEGRLFLQDSFGSVELNSAYIVVTGSLQIGCRIPSGATHPYTKQATIRLIAPETYGTGLPNLDPSGVRWTDSAAASHFSSGSEVELAAHDRGLIITEGGTLYIYGKDKGKSWTQLSSTANAGTSNLILQDVVDEDWSQNDEIVIASTDFEYDSWNAPNAATTYVQGEKRIIDSIVDGNMVQFSSALNYMHFGEVIHGPPPHDNDPAWDIPVQAEVGLLTRNVVIEGQLSDHSSSANHSHGPQHYGHVILLPYNDQNPYFEVKWAEFRNLGVEGTLSRYPFHVHILGDARANGAIPYLRNSSIHDCVHRFVTIHDTQYVKVENNVGWKTLGHGFYLEESDPENPGLTKHIELRGNLGMWVDPPTTFDSDTNPIIVRTDREEPGVFWLQHPDNMIEGNHAAGAFGHGFYLAPPKDVWVHTTTSNSYFRDNLAHSNGQHGFYHNIRTKWQWEDGNPNHLPTASGLVAYKNRRYGVWWRSHGSVLLEDMKAADNKSGLYPATDGLVDAGSDYTGIITLRDCTIYGDTINIGTPVNDAEIQAGRSLPQTYMFFERPTSSGSALPRSSAWDILNAIEAYDGYLRLEGMRVAYFQDIDGLVDPQGGPTTADRKSAGITQVEYRSRYQEDPRNYVNNWIFGPDTVDHKVYYRIPIDEENMIKNTVVHDLDNSLGQGSDVYLAYLDDFLIANADPSAPPVALNQENAYVVPAASGDFAQIDVIPMDAGSRWPNANAEMVVSTLDFNNVQRSMTIYPTNPDGALDRHYPFTGILGLEKVSAGGLQGVFQCSFQDATGYPDQYLIKIQNARAVDKKVIVGVPLASSPTTVRLNDGSIQVIDGNSQGITSLSGLVSSSFDHVWFFDQSANPSMLYIKTTTILEEATHSVDWEGTRNELHLNSSGF
ncbi:MAG: hypothetical protein DWQ01_06220 [Planctomycetota bacterium]|nr:MAG: hypothetical protein DWQ01_06220 [Planctomycetota bacterium]